jgi:FlaA1/EpsC-like NDP-sugar epimerase
LPKTIPDAIQTVAMILQKLTLYTNLRTAFLLLFYLFACIISFWLAYEMRFDFAIPHNHFQDRASTIWWVIPLKLFALLLGRQLDCILPYFRLPDAIRLFTSLLGAAAFMAVLWYALKGDGVPTRAVIITDFILSFMLIASFRMLLRVVAERQWNSKRTVGKSEGVIIAGAGEVGASLCAELLHRPHSGLRPLAFVDDDPRKIGRFVHGIAVEDTTANLAAVADRCGAKKLIIAIPSARPSVVGELAKKGRAAGLQVEIVPALMDLVSGRARATQLRAVDVGDLLGRETVNLETAAIRQMIAGQTVMVTGAGGSIGRELARQIVDWQPASIVLLDQSELALFELEQFLGQGNVLKYCHYIIADIADTTHMQTLLANYKPTIIFHAAAHKHVHFMETQPAEALRNNFIATAQLARLAQTAAVQRFILISTDKAIHPTSVMGATKRLAEIAIAACQKEAPDKTRFMAVRFGNVIGSSGSVFEVFRRQIAAGGPITVTDPDATRYFMTVCEAAGLVLQCASQGKGGEIFLLNMGEPVKIIDIARQMIQLSGYEPEVDIPIRITGLKPGEKSKELLSHLDEFVEQTDHPMVMRLKGNRDLPELAALLQAFEGNLNTLDNNTLKAAIKIFVPEYTPSKIPPLSFN